MAELDTLCCAHSPDVVALEDAILMALRWRLPLDHDGLVGAATGNDILWGCRGGFLRKGYPDEEKVIYEACSVGLSLCLVKLLQLYHLHSWCFKT